jgi:hypothetical protein
MRTPQRRSLLGPETFGSIAFAVVVAAACVAPPTETDPRGTGSSGASSSSGSHGTSSSSGSSGTTGSSGSSGPSGSSGSGPPIDPHCAGTTTTAEQQPVDIYMMLDRSASMNDPVALGATTRKWDAVASALSSFVGQPMSGTSVGLQYFPASSGDLCQAASYEPPAVEIGLLAQTGPSVTQSMTAQRPAGLTPTIAALQSAIAHARAWAAKPANAGHAVLVIFATDGAPTLCDGDLARIDAVAAAGLNGTPSVRTFVIGVGDLRNNLDGIAAAGGTTSAFILNSSPTLGADFLKALNDIRKTAVSCSFALYRPPDGTVLDLGSVNVQYAPGGGGAAVQFARVAGAGACGTRTGAWYYDDPTAPTKITLCPETCATIQGNPGAKVELVLGCKTIGEW